MDFLESKVKMAKQEVLEMCINAGVGHVSSAFSCAEIVASLYYKVMKIDPKNPQWNDRDRFIMSKNHGSVITYPILADLGFFQIEDARNFLKDGSPFGIHTKRDVAGADFCGGSLGIGLGMGCGLAYAAKLDKKDWLTFVIVGDGECYEGSIWEAAMFAGHNKLDNLIVFVDKNNQAITDYTYKMLSQESIAEKWKSFQWEVRKIDGHNINEILSALGDVRQRQAGKPLCIVADTIKGNGLPLMENKLFWHGRAPGKDQAELARQQLRGDNV